MADTEQGGYAEPTFTLQPSVANEIEATLPSSKVHVYFIRKGAPKARDPNTSSTFQPYDEDFTMLHSVTISAPYRRPLRPGFLYIRYINNAGKARWLEYEVLDYEEQSTGPYQHLKELQPATDKIVTFVALPRTQIDVAFSEIRWHADLRKALNDNKDKGGLRARRMLKIDLTGWPPATPDANVAEEDEESDQASDERIFPLDKNHLYDEVPELFEEWIDAILEEANKTNHPKAIVCIDDHIGIARQRAANYQATWPAMEKYLNEAPQHKWYRCATMLQALLKRKDLKEQFSELDYDKLAEVLQLQRGMSIRSAIRWHKQCLVDYLDGEDGRNGFVAALDDYAYLPVENGEDPCYADQWGVVAEVIALLGRSLSHSLFQTNSGTSNPSNPPQDEKKDIGFEFLAKLASPEGGHPLHSRLFPCRKTDESAAEEDKDIFSPTFQEKKVMDFSKLGERGVETLSGFVSYFAKLGIDESLESARTVMVELMVAAKVPIKMLELDLDQIEGKAPLPDTRYKHIRFHVDETAQKLGVHKSKFDGSTEGLEGRVVARWSPPGGDAKEVVGATSLEEYRQAQGQRSAETKAERDLIRKEINKTKFKKVKARMVVMDLPPDGSAAQFWIEKNSKYSIPMSGAIAAFQSWNLYRTIDAIKEEGHEVTGRDAMEVIGGMADVLGTITEIVDKRLNKSALDTPFDEIVKKGGWGRAARCLGAVGGFIDFGTSLQDFTENLLEGDDAAIGYGIMAFGFGLELAVLLVGSTPFGWVALGIVLIGMALNKWVFTDDTKLELWVKNGPFHNESKILWADEEEWNARPDLAYEALLNAAFKMQLELKQTLVFTNPKDASSDFDTRLFAKVKIPYFLAGKSVLEIRNTWMLRQKADPADMETWPYVETPISEERKLESVELDDEGWYVFELCWPDEIKRYDEVSIKLLARLNIHGDGSAWIPGRSRWAPWATRRTDGAWVQRSQSFKRGAPFYNPEVAD